MSIYIFGIIVSFGVVYSLAVFYLGVRYGHHEERLEQEIKDWISKGRI